MPIIYHYCDSSAFLSIIKNGELWLSSFKRMNDRMELAILRSAVQSKFADLSASGEVPISDIHLLEHVFQTVEFYGVCFSGACDQLYQWTAYGDRGQGYAIGFDSSALFPPTPYSDELHEKGPLWSADPNHQFDLCKVTYGSSEIVEGYVDEAVEAYFQMKRTKHPNAIIATQIIGARLAAANAAIKNPGFSVEDEWRLTYCPLESAGLDVKPSPYTGPMKWRNGRYGLTPYYSYSSTGTHGVKNSIREIIVGPTNIERLDTEHLYRFLQSNDIQASVKLSESTLR